MHYMARISKFMPTLQNTPRAGKREAHGGENDKSGSRERKLNKNGSAKKWETSDDAERPSKRVKREDSEKGSNSLADRIGDKVKSENPLGSMIGRKRKMKKVGGRK